MNEWRVWKRAYFAPFCSLLLLLSLLLPFSLLFFLYLPISSHSDSQTQCHHWYQTLPCSHPKPRKRAWVRAEQIGEQKKKRRKIGKEARRMKKRKEEEEKEMEERRKDKKYSYSNCTIMRTRKQESFLLTEGKWRHAYVATQQQSYWLATIKQPHKKKMKKANKKISCTEGTSMVSTTGRKKSGRKVTTVTEVAKRKFPSTSSVTWQRLSAFDGVDMPLEKWKKINGNMSIRPHSNKKTKACKNNGKNEHKIAERTTKWQNEKKSKTKNQTKKNQQKHKKRERAVAYLFLFVFDQDG